MFLSILIFVVGGGAALAALLAPLVKTDPEVAARVAGLNEKHTVVAN